MITKTPFQTSTFAYIFCLIPKYLIYEQKHFRILLSYRHKRYSGKFDRGKSDWQQSNRQLTRPTHLTSER